MEEVVIPDGVTRIASKAFYRNKTITSVIIPDSVTYIEEYAFGNCKNLKNVQMANSVEDIESGAFKGCTNLNKIQLSNQLMLIRAQIFSWCNRVEELVIPEGAKLLLGPIGINSLKSLTLPSTMIYADLREDELNSLEVIYITGGGNEYLMEILEQYGWEQNKSVSVQKDLLDVVVMQPRKNIVKEEITEDSAEFIIQDGVLIKYQGTATEVNVPKGVTVIGEKAFFSNDNLLRVVLPEGVEQIADEAFAYCGELKEVSMPESLRQIGSYAFNYCKKLEMINISQVEKIEFAAFYRCAALNKVNLSSLKCLGDKVFYGASALTEILGLVKLPKITGNGFAGSRYWEEYGEGKENAFWIMDGVLLSGSTCSGAVQIPDTVTKIAANAFMNNDKITSVMIPDSVTEIGANAFQYCKKLKTVRMEDSVARLGEYAFSECRRLTDIRLSNQLQLLPIACFYECSNLKRITLPERVIMIGNSCFWECGKLTEITLPNGVLEWDIDYETRQASIYVANTDLSYYLQDLEERKEWNVNRLELAVNELTLTVGEKYPLRFIGGAKAIWKSSGKSVAYVGRTGNIYARSPGRVTITGTIYGKEYTCRVTVE